MLKTRILIAVISAAVIIGIFYLPKVVVENDTTLAESSDSVSTGNKHVDIAPQTQKQLNDLKAAYAESPTKEKSIIFADSLADLYLKAG